MNISIFAIITFSFWLLVLTYFFFRQTKHYDRLTGGITKGGLREVLEKILKKIENQEIKTEKLEKWCQDLEKDGSFHLQKIGLLRFNPFADTGGNQSFILAILDRHNNGAVITSLHSRAGTRWYVKSVKKGKGGDYEFSSEEERVIKEAKIFA